MLIFLDNDNTYSSLKEAFLHLCKIIDGDETAIMECNKSINDGIGESTEKLFASIDESSDSSLRVKEIIFLPIKEWT